VLRAIPRTVFYPAPRVDSVLVALRRRESSEISRSSAERARASDASLRPLVYGAFAHRRKALAGSLALAASASTATGAPPSPSRERVRAALMRLGHPPDARAERLSPQDFRNLAEMLAE
jgi:16S rRNA (adenine1518-N6/adenine1519-N6)-dimethyltransferase